MSCCCYCGAPHGALLDYFHWEWCRRALSKNEHLTVWSPSDPPAVKFNLDGDLWGVPRGVMCYLCWQREGRHLCPVTYRLSDSAHYPNDAGWVPLCEECWRLSNEERQGRLEKSGSE